MKAIIAFALTFFSIQTFADSFSLKKGLPTIPRDDIGIARDWEKCFNQADNVSFVSDYAHLENTDSDCTEMGLEQISFKLSGKSYLMDLPPEANPFIRLKDSKVTLTAFSTDITQIRLSSSHNFIPDLILDLRLSTTKSGIRYDYFIAKRESLGGWEKIKQVFVSTEERSQECRPRMNCSYSVKIYEQDWKHTFSGKVVKKTIEEVQ